MPTSDVEGSAPLGHPKHEIYCLEMAAGLSEQDAYLIAGIDYAMPREEGETAGKRRSRVQVQLLRRINARLFVLEHYAKQKDLPVDFMFRNARAAAELRWFKMVTEAGGVEPELDDDGHPVQRQADPPPTEKNTRGDGAAENEVST